jgi:hypothetical protein
MIESNENSPESVKNDTPAEPITKPSELFIQNAINRFKDQTTLFPKVW